MLMAAGIDRAVDDSRPACEKPMNSCDYITSKLNLSLITDYKQSFPQGHFEAQPMGLMHTSENQASTQHL